MLLQQQHKDISITTESVAYQYTEQDPVDRSDCRGSEEGEGSAQPVWTQIGIATGRDQVPTEINNGIVIPRRDLETIQEEADVIIVQQMVAITEEHCGDGSESCVMILMSLCYCCTSTVS